MSDAHNKVTASDVVRRQLLELSATAAGIGSFDWDLTSGTLTWDDRLIELFGYELEGFDESIDSFNARLHPDDLARVGAELKHAIETCGEFRSEYRVVRPDGKTLWVGARGKTLCDEDGVAQRLLGAAWDNTAQVASNTMAARGLESMATAYFSLDEEWRFTYANAAATELLGKARSELVGGVVWDVFPDALNTNFETECTKTMNTGEQTAFDAYYPAPLDKWFEVRAWRESNGIAVYFLDITSRVAATDAAVAAARRAHLLSRITEELGGTLAHDEAARRLVHLAVPELADWGIVNLIDDESQTGERRGLRFVASHSEDPERADIVRRYAELRLANMKNDDIIVRALQTGEVQRLESGAVDAVLAMLNKGPQHELMAQLAPESVIVVPLIGPSGPIGMLSLANTKERGSFTDVEVVTAEEVGARAGLVLENARLYRQQRLLAEGLQRSLLTPPAEPDHVEVLVRYEPASQASQVGGDWYDSFLQPGGAMVLVIGDVIGHDSVAAATMGQLRSIVRTLGAVADDSPAQILSKTDDVMETLLVNTTATAVVARLEQTEEQIERGETTVRWTNAGHPAPIVIETDGSIFFLDDEPAELLLGVDSHFDRSESTIVLNRDAVIIFYTDGLIERREQGVEAGMARLKKVIAPLSTDHLGPMCDQLLKALLPDEPEDDVALLAVKLHRQDQPRPGEAGPNRVPPHVPRDL